MRHAFPLLHRVQTTEIYYLLSGAGTLVTDGELIDSSESPNNPPSQRPRIRDRFRADPENRLTLR